MEIQPEILLGMAALLKGSKNQTRDYANCLLVDGNKIIATDGHLLGVYCNGHEEGPSYTVSVEDITNTVKKNDGMVAIDQGQIRQGARAVTTTDSDKVDYPDWRVIVDDQNPNDPHEPAMIDPVLAIRFTEASKIFSGVKKKNAPRIWTRGNKPAIVQLPHHPEFFGIVMPFSTTGTLASAFPKWLYPRQEEVAHVA